MIIFTKICISDDYRGFILLFVHPAFFAIEQSCLAVNPPCLFGLLVRLSRNSVWAILYLYACFLSRHYILRLILPLISYLVFLLQLFYNVLLAAKRTKSPGTEFTSRMMLCSSCIPQQSSTLIVGTHR